MEVPLRLVLLEVVDLFLEFVKLIKNRGNFNHDRLLSVLAIREVAKSLLFEEPIDKQTLDLLELCKQLVEFLVVILFDGADLLAHVAQFGNLVLDLVLELGDFTLQVVHAELF